MFYFWREATAALVPGFLCQSGRRRPENVSILSSLMISATAILSNVKFVICFEIEFATFLKAHAFRY